MAERVLVLGFALTFYCLGTTYFEAFVNYRTWAQVGAREFPAYHQALTPLVVKVMLVPIAVYALCLVSLLVLQPASVPRAAIAGSLVLLSIAILSSVFIQIPIQRQLDEAGLSAPLLQRLISTDLALRKLPLGLNALLWLAMFWSRGVPAGAG